MSLYLGEEKIKNISVGLQAVGVDVTGLNSETTTSFDGIIKGENGKATTAVPGVDYLAPDALNSLGSLANKNKVSESDLDDALKQTIEDASNIQLPEGIVQNNIVNTFTADGKITMADGYAPSNDGDLVNKKYVDTQIKATVPAYSNGPILFEANGTFNPSTYNLKVGDKIQVLCIGGGAGGHYGRCYQDSDAGKDAGTCTYGDYGCGGEGGYAKTTIAEQNDAWMCGSGGDGGGGFLTKAIVTLDSTDAVTITIGQGGKGASVGGTPTAGGTTSFGAYLSAEGGKIGTAGSGSEIYKDYYGDNGSGGQGYTATGWCVESYSVQTANNSSTHKGSGAVFIWY